MQCCVSGSGILCFFYPLIQDPDSGMNIIFPRTQEHFLGLKILKIFDADPDPGSGIFLTLDQ
jgi:hypothetical protein